MRKINKFNAERERQGRSKITLVVKAFLLTLFFGALFVILAVGNWKMYFKEKSIASEAEKLRAKESELQKENAVLESKLSQIEELYLEEIARDDLNLRKEGEQVVVFPDLPRFSQSNKKPEQEKSFWEKILDVLK